MTIAIILKTAIGSLFQNSNKETGQPDLTGFVEFPLDENKDGRKLRLEVGGWEKESNGKKYYSLSVGGLPASLFKETQSAHEKAPDYTGTFGVHKELRIAGWKRISPKKVPYISLAISEKTEKTTTAGSDPVNDSGRHTAAPATVGNPFDFV